MCTKFDIEKFDGKNDFGLWQVRMKDLLEQLGLAAAFEELRKRLYTFDMHPGKSQSEHINEFHKMVGNLAAIDTVISDEDQTLLLITSLPSSYNNFVETLLYGQDTLKLEGVLATLNSRELQKMTEAKGDGGEGLYVRGRSGQIDIEQGKDSIITRNLKVLSGMKIRYPVLEVSCSRAVGYDSADILMAMSVEELLDWIMDSGGSYHMTYKRD
ncbi:hypothetical protein Tco_1025665, partial [Tanacetum coccineum]